MKPLINFLLNLEDLVFYLFYIILYLLTLYYNSEGSVVLFPLYSYVTSADTGYLQIKNVPYKTYGQNIKYE